LKSSPNGSISRTRQYLEQNISLAGISLALPVVLVMFFPITFLENYGLK
jgi:hypothetical protein